MCSTCNYKLFNRVTVESGNKSEEKLEQSIGLDDLVIRCNLDGKDYSIEIINRPKSGFRIYRCPTCGRCLF